MAIARDEGIPEAPMLRTCKLICSEAMGIYYRINSITVEVEHYSRHLCELAKRLKEGKKVETPVLLNILDEPD